MCPPRLLPLYMVLVTGLHWSSPLQLGSNSRCDSLSFPPCLWSPCSTAGPGRDWRPSGWRMTDRPSMLDWLCPSQTSWKNNTKKASGQQCPASRRSPTPGPTSTTWTSTPYIPRWCRSIQVPQVVLLLYWHKYLLQAFYHHIFIILITSLINVFL